MKISIPQPCSEDWSKMTPTEQGAFCKKCAMEVTDFTDKSSLEIKEILTAKMQSKERVCGHIENRQMVEFNNEFIPWRSDSESFRAIWVFSLVAVFGLTLFSCQSTFSKEIVEKMNTSTEQMLEDEKDTLDIAKLNDSIAEMKTPDSIPNIAIDPWAIINPYEITGGPVIMNGGMGLQAGELTEIEICMVTLGDFTWVGTITTGPKKEEITPFSPLLITESPAPSVPPYKQSPAPVVHEPNQTNTQRLNAKLEKGRPEFDAYISPIPIEKSSKLFVTIPDEGELKLSIWEVPSITKLHSETFDMVFGNHAVDINFHDFSIGKYAVQLTWEDEKIVLPFEILPKLES
jgi:hypothetical protein